MDCPGHEELVAFLEGRLQEGASSAMDDHMDGCGACRSLVAGLARSGLAAASTVFSPEPAGPLDGSTLVVAGDVVADRFEIIRRVGAGAMGIVHEAIDRELGVKVALKVLRPDAAAQQGLIDRLRREIVLGRRITHPNVCRLHDLGTSDGVHFITMEFVEGETLAARIARGPIDALQALRVIEGICDALAAAHAESVVHRDLKPANVMVGADGRVWVMDFGLARDLRAERSVEGALVGTPAYWAPEQARGERATERSDLYALGVIACELLTGCRPRWGEPLPESLPARLRGVIARCLTVDPEDRVSSAREVRRALAEARRLRARRGRVAVSAIGLAAALALVLVALWRIGGPDRAEARPTSARIEEVTPAAPPPPPPRGSRNPVPASPREALRGQAASTAPAPSAPVRRSHRPVVPRRTKAAAPEGQPEWFFFE